jgi:hypothetical protein
MFEFEGLNEAKIKERKDDPFYRECLKTAARALFGKTLEYTVSVEFSEPNDADYWGSATGIAFCLSGIGIATTVYQSKKLVTLQGLGIDRREHVSSGKEAYVLCLKQLKEVIDMALLIYDL